MLVTAARVTKAQNTGGSRVRAAARFMTTRARGLHSASSPAVNGGKQQSRKAGRLSTAIEAYETQARQRARARSLSAHGKCCLRLKTAVIVRAKSVAGKKAGDSDAHRSSSDRKPNDRSGSRVSNNGRRRFHHRDGSYSGKQIFAIPAESGRRRTLVVPMRRSKDEIIAGNQRSRRGISFQSSVMHHMPVFGW